MKTTIINKVRRIFNRSNDGHTMARKEGGANMAQFKTALMAIMFLALCALTGCSDPGGNDQGNVGLFPINSEQACANVPEDDTELAELCADLTNVDLNATLTPPAKDEDGDGNNDAVPMTSELASTDVDGSTALAFSFVDVVPNTVYGFTVDEDGLPTRCHLESDGMDHLESTINFGDEEVLEPKPLDLVCSPKEEEADGGIDVIVVVDGGIDMDDICPYVGATITVAVFDGSQPVTPDAEPLVGATVVLSGPLAQYEEMFEDFSPTCTTTAAEPTCTFECLLPQYHSITVTADNFEGLIWDNNSLDLEAGEIYDLQFPLEPSTSHPENSLVEFPGFNMAVGTTMNASDMYFARYDADETAVPIPADEATYEVVDGTSVTLEGGASDAGVDPISGDLAVLTATEEGQTHIQRCWLGVEPNPCQTFTVTVY